MTDSNRSIIGLQFTIIGFFVSWMFQHSILFYIGVLFVVLGSLITILESLYN